MGFLKKKVDNDLLTALIQLQEMDYEKASPEMKKLYDCLYLYTSWSLTTHLGWIKALGDMIDAGEVSPIELDPAKSTFGRVYPVLEPYADEVKEREIWARVAANHKKSYELGNKVYTAISRGNTGEARQAYAEVQKLGDQIAKDVAVVRDSRVKSDFSELAAQLKMMGL